MALFKTINIFLISFCFFNLYAQKTTSIYVSAHPDDWQLFMNPNAYNSVKNPNEKAVFIHTTESSVGAGTTTNFYLAREKGSLRAIRFMANTVTTGAGLGTDMNETMVNINGHQIRKYTYRNTVAYFLRLPEGGEDGRGYSSFGYRSLQKFYNGTVTDYFAIDGTTTYSSLNDLQNTLKALIEIESEGSSNITLHVGDDNSSINPKDHSDHIYSSKILQNSVKTLNDVTIKLYTEYHTKNKSQNVFDYDFIISAGTWGVTASGLSDFFHRSTWDNGHNVWIGKQYFRTKSINTTDPTNPNINIALNKPTSSSYVEDGNESSNAVDDIFSLNNYWAANSHTEWWQVDLKDVYKMNKIIVTNYHDGNRYYQYNIESSLDGINWTQIVDFSKNTNPASSQGDSFNLSNISSRYLRVNTTFNSANSSVHIIEFQAYGILASLSLPEINNNTLNLSIYPNPINKGDNFLIETNYLINNNILLEAYDIKGVNIIRKTIHPIYLNNKLSLNTSALSLGWNIIKLTTNNKSISKKIFVK